MIDDVRIPTLVLSIDIGITNFCFCIVEFYEDTFRVVEIEKVCIGNKSASGRVLAEALIDFLHDSPKISHKTFHYIFVEAQLSKAVKNNILAYAVLTYFLTLNKEKESEKRATIHFVPPRSKFDAVSEYFPGILDGKNLTRTTKSKELKKISIQIASEIFSELQISKGLEAIVNNSPKVDDVADTFLQSFSFLLDKYA